MSEHVVPVKTYVMVFLALMVGTALTVWVSLVDITLFPHANVAIALVIACIKATLVILFFMHVKYSPRLTTLVVAAGFVFLFLLILFTGSDYISRSWPITPAG